MQDQLAFLKSLLERLESGDVSDAQRWQITQLQMASGFLEQCDNFDQAELLKMLSLGFWLYKYSLPPEML